VAIAEQVMFESLSDLRGKRVHFVGILGEGMQRLATFAAECGAIVTGSDLRESPDAKRLRTVGIEVTCGEQKRLGYSPEVVVASQAIPEGHGEIAEADERGLEVMKYPDFVGRIMEQTRGIAVAGTHGKSTTASLISFILTWARRDPSFLVGADVPQLGGGSHRGTGEFFVAEACEYRRSFLYLEPEIGVITGVDFDHSDYYFNFDDILRAFGHFTEQIAEDGLLVLNEEDPNTAVIREEAPCRVETFSVGVERGDWQARRIWRAKKHTNFDLYERGKLVGRMSMPLYGNHNVANALAAIAVARRCGVSYEDISEALDLFTGPARRLQLIGEPWGIPVLSDYAHHPREVEATLSATRQRFPSKPRVFLIFQPHQHSRTKQFLADFAEALSGVHLCVIADIYGVRDPDDVRRSISSLDLVREIQNFNRQAFYMPDFRDIEDFIAGEVVMNDVVLVMGAGNVGQLAKRIIKRIEHKVKTGRVAA
jgi:UDP-N-acetylmuramate--alanine ligase